MEQRFLKLRKNSQRRNNTLGEASLIRKNTVGERKDPISLQFILLKLLSII